MPVSDKKVISFNIFLASKVDRMLTAVSLEAHDRLVLGGYSTKRPMQYVENTISGLRNQFASGKKSFADIDRYCKRMSRSPIENLIRDANPPFGEHF